MIRLTPLYFAIGFGAATCAACYAEGIEGPSTAEWNSNLRWAVDLSSRYVDNEASDSFFVNAYGFDLHKVFSSADGDIGTLVFQPYLVDFSDAAQAPYYFGGSESDLTWRIANFNYTALSQGQFNVRLGHFEVPFGLEQYIDTNGTIRQLTFPNRGIKADWGISVNGVLPQIDYEFSVTRGSGNDISDRDSPYIVAGRVGTPTTSNLIAGLSYFDGEVLSATGTVRRERWGLDLAWYRYNWECLFEVSSGKDEDADVVDGLVELGWRSREETVHSYGQFRQFQQKSGGSWERGSEVAVGLVWSLPLKFIVSGEWRKPVATLGDRKDASTLVFQVRTRI